VSFVTFVDFVMIRAVRLLLCCCLLAAAACDEKVTGPTAPLNSEFTLAPGEAAAIEGAALTVRFNRITGDNRCPADAVCILGGSADVNITAVADGLTRDYVLKTGDMRPVQHNGYTIALIQVAPYPFSARPIQTEEYRVTLRVTR
jgi:hypothetical protein